MAYHSRKRMRLGRLLKPLTSGLFAPMFGDVATELQLWWRHHVYRKSTHPGDPMSQIKVEQVMNPQILTVPTTMDMAKLAHVFERWKSRAVLVMDPHGAFYGVLSLPDFKRVLMDEATNQPTAGDIAVRAAVTVYPDECASVILACMASGDLWCLPVVDRSQPPRPLGVLYRDDLNRFCDIEEQPTNYNFENC